MYGNLRIRQIKGIRAMPVHVWANPGSVHALTFGAEAILRDAIGDRSGDWNVFIVDMSPASEYVITIDGPDDFFWRRKFHGSNQQTLEFIIDKIQKSLPPPSPPKKSARNFPSRRAGVDRARTAETDVDKGIE
jgi:hypothetical protein